jgi:hypothetical protein
MLSRDATRMQESTDGVSLRGDIVRSHGVLSLAMVGAFRSYGGNMIPLILGLLLFVMNNLAPLGALLHPRPGYAPLLMPRNQDSAQYLTWIEAFKNGWAIPNYHAPWETEAALHVPLMWLVAKLSAFTRIPAVYAYLGFEATCYVLAFYALAFLLRVFTVGLGQSALAVALMICAVPMRSFALLPALLLKGRAWALLHCGYGELSSEGLFQGISCSATITFGTATALLSLALLGRYFYHGRKSELWAASLVVALSGFLHPFEFIPITVAAGLVLLWTSHDLQSALIDLSILCIPASAVVLFYFLPTLTHPWIKVAVDLNRLHNIDISHHFVLHLGWPLLIGFVLAFFRSGGAPRKDRFLACYVVVSVLALRMPFLPWPLHFKDGLDYAAAILVVRKLETTPRLVGLWANQNLWRLGFVVLLVGAALAPHIYFRYLTYRIGATATEAFGDNPAVATVDEVRAIAWLRANGASEKLVLAPLENAPWMATVPMHSFASHWIFSLTNDQQAPLSMAFFQGSLSDAASDSLLRSYGVRYVLAPARSPALRYIRNAELRWAGERLVLYELPYNDMRPLPRLMKVSPGHYVWNPD